MHHQLFFKTGKGEYGEGDVFMGITIPQLKATCRPFLIASLTDIADMLESPPHEVRYAALHILRKQFERKQTSPQHKQAIVRCYIAEAMAGRINNWDLVDTSACAILGEASAQGLCSYNSVLHTLLSDTPYHLWTLPLPS